MSNTTSIEKPYGYKIPRGQELTGTKENNKPQLFDCRKNRWGHSTELRWGDDAKELDPDGAWLVQGCLTPLPKDGDFVLKGSQLLQFSDVSAHTGRDPKDFFMARTFELAKLTTDYCEFEDSLSILLKKALEFVAESPDLNKAGVNYIV